MSAVDPVVFDRASAEKLAQMGRSWLREHTPLTNRKAFEPRLPDDSPIPWLCIYDVVASKITVKGSSANVIDIGLDALTVLSDADLSPAEGCLKLKVFWDGELNSWNYSFVIESCSETASSGSSGSSSSAAPVLVIEGEACDSSSSGSATSSSSASSQPSVCSWTFTLATVTATASGYSIVQELAGPAICSGAYVRQRVVMDIWYDSASNAIYKKYGNAVACGCGG